MTLASQEHEALQEQSLPDFSIPQETVLCAFILSPINWTDMHWDVGFNIPSWPRTAKPYNT